MQLEEHIKQLEGLQVPIANAQANMRTARERHPSLVGILHREVLVADLVASYWMGKTALVAARAIPHIPELIKMRKEISDNELKNGE
jgi:hypothetical protein